MISDKDLIKPEKWTYSLSYLRRQLRYNTTYLKNLMQNGTVNTWQTVDSFLVSVIEQTC